MVSLQRWASIPSSKNRLMASKRWKVRSGKNQKSHSSIILPYKRVCTKYYIYTLLYERRSGYTTGIFCDNSEVKPRPLDDDTKGILSHPNQLSTRCAAESFNSVCPGVVVQTTLNFADIRWIAFKWENYACLSNDWESMLCGAILGTSNC